MSFSGYPAGFEEEPAGALFRVKLDHWFKLKPIARELGYDPVFWHFAALMEAASKNCAMRFMLRLGVQACPD